MKESEELFLRETPKLRFKIRDVLLSYHCKEFHNKKQ